MERNPGYQVKHVQKKQQHRLLSSKNATWTIGKVWYGTISLLTFWVGYSADVNQAVKELVGEKRATILQRMQRCFISSTLDIALVSKFLLKQRWLLPKRFFRKKNYYWILKFSLNFNFWYVFAMDLKLGRMVDKISGQINGSIFIYVNILILYMSQLTTMIFLIFQSIFFYIRNAWRRGSWWFFLLILSIQTC